MPIRKRCSSVTRWIFWVFVLTVGGLSSTLSAEAPDQKSEQAVARSDEAAADLSLLQKAGIGPDPASVLAFFRNRSAIDIQPKNIDHLIKQLGGDSYQEREKASRALVSAGPVVLPQLRLALKANDREVIQRAQTCIQQIRENAESLDLPFAALRVLVRKRPAEAVVALLQYLAVVHGAELKVAIWYGLDTLAVRDGRVDPAFLAALKDGAPARRAAAACILGSHGTPSQRAAVHQCLTDTDPEVRLLAAQGLLAANDKAAIPALIELLDQPAIALAWQAEELLHWFAGTPSPGEVVGAGTAEARTRCRLAWTAWWKEKGGRLDPRQARSVPQCPCLLLICEPGDAPDRNFPKRRHGRVFLCGSDGRSRWQIPDLVTPVDVELLSGNRLLIAEEAANRLTERNLEGKLLREYLVDGPKSIRRDADGVLVVSRGRRELVYRFGNDHTGLYRREFPPDRLTCALDGARVLSNGHAQYLYHLQADEGKENIFEENEDGTLRMRPSGFRRPEWLAEMDPATGKECGTVRITGISTWLQGADMYGDKHVLLAQGGELVEVGPTDQVRWRGPLPVAEPTSAVQLPTGNLLVAGKDDWNVGVVTEIDRGAKTKWEGIAESALACPRSAFPLLGLGFARHQPSDWDLNALALRVKALKDPSSLLRRRSLAAIQRIGPAAVKALPAVIDALDDPDEPGIRPNVGRVLAAIGPEAMPALAAALTDPRPTVRAGAAHAFAYFHKQPDKYVPSLTAALRDKDAKVRRNAVGTLGAFGAKAGPAVPMLVQMLQEEKDSRAVDDLLFALARIGPEAHLAVPELARLLEASYKAPSILVVRALEEIGPRAKAAVPVLVKSLKAASSERDGSSLADALGAIGPDARDAVPVLVAIVKGGSPHCPRDAVRALGDIGAEPKVAIPALIIALSDPEERTVAEAALALKKFGRAAKDALPALKEARSRLSNEVFNARLESCISQIQNMP